MTKVRQRFESVKMLTAPQVAADFLRDSVISLAETLDDTLPDGREKSLALTNLEECLMWATKSVAHNQDHFNRHLPETPKEEEVLS